MNAIDIFTSPAMNMLYDSESYVVVHVQPTEGDAPLAPHLPVEEPFFLAFLCQLALTVWAAAERRGARRRERMP